VHPQHQKSPGPDRFESRDLRRNRHR
jgi:hypothetical protein